MATDKKNKKKQSKPKKRLVHIDDFIAEAGHVYGLSDLQVSGFKAYMNKKKYLSSLEAFDPYLKHYLGLDK